MNSPYVPVGPEVAPISEASQPVAPPTLGPQSSSTTTGLSPASIGLIAVFLSLFGLVALGVIVCWMRRWQTTTKFADEQPPEKAAVGDVEALGATRPIIPVIPLPDVRWAPQIRSIRGPASHEGSYAKLAGLPLKRARSPPPSRFIKPLDMSPEAFPKSAPAYALSFSQNEAPYPEKSLRGDMFPAVSPRALSVSGMQTRSLGRFGLVSKG